MAGNMPGWKRGEASPVELIDTGSEHPTVEPGIALCLSGGGYRAMLFHVGALRRLNEAAYLPRLDRISSVSGGSITAAVLGHRWSGLGFEKGIATRLDDELVAPVRHLASSTIDAGAIWSGLLGPGSIADRMADAYRRHLFGDATLQDLCDRPRLVLNATNVQSGALWRFMKPYMRDYRVGEVRDPDVPLAVAVAASAAFPPLLSPVILDLSPSRFTPGSGMGLERIPFTSRVVLTDGGVYDNLGLEAVWKRFDTILVSDGGGKTEAEDRPGRDWFRHTYRVIELIHGQVGSLRKRSLIAAFERADRKGGYWGITTDIGNYGLPDALPCPMELTARLAHVPTRLARLDDTTQERLINWGYAACDAAFRRHLSPDAATPKGFPYPAAGVG